jgi:hypothetical protein
VGRRIEQCLRERFDKYTDRRFESEARVLPDPGHTGIRTERRSAAESRSSGHFQSLQLGFTFSAALSQSGGDLVPVAECVLQTKARNDRELDLMKGKLEFTPVA